MLKSLINILLLWAKEEEAPIVQVQPLGWVNVFVTEQNKVRISCHPYKTKEQALNLRKKDCTSTYLRTVEIQELIC